MQTREFSVVARGDAIEVSGTPSGTLGYKYLARDGLPDGTFFEWNWDGERLIARVDRLGIYPAYWSPIPGGIAIADNVTSLIRMGADCALDGPAMAAFLHLGYFLGEDTPFQAIHALSPGAALTWAPPSEVHVTASDYAPPTPFAGSRIDAMENYTRLFRDAIVRSLPDRAPVVVPLSGGRDSRHILFELVRAGIRPRCVTARSLPPQSDEDVRIAGLLATALGLECEIVAQTDRLFEAEYAKNLATGFCSDEGAWQMQLGARLNGSHSTVYDGIGGDVLSAGLFALPPICEAARQRDPVQFARACIDARVCDDGFGEDAVRYVLTDRAYAEFGLPIALERIQREAVRHLNAPNPVASFYFFNRTRREITLFPHLVLGGGNTVVCPYVDTPLVQFLLTLPLDLVCDQQLHTETIARAFPQYSAIPYEDKAAVGSSAAPLNARYGHDVARSALTRGLAAPLRRGRLVPRLMRALFDRTYAEQMRWYAGCVQYLNQIAWECAQPRGDGRR